MIIDHNTTTNDNILMQAFLPDQVVLREDRAGLDPAGVREAVLRLMCVYVSIYIYI